MKDEQLSIFARLLDSLVEPRFIPHFQQLRLARDQIRLHRKIRAREIERVFVILAHRGARTLTFTPSQINAMPATPSIYNGNAANELALAIRPLGDISQNATHRIFPRLVAWLLRVPALHHSSSSTAKSVFPNLASGRPVARFRLSGFPGDQSFESRANCRCGTHRRHWRAVTERLRRANQFFAIAFLTAHERLRAAARSGLRLFELRR